MITDLDDLLHGQIATLMLLADGEQRNDQPLTGVILSGSFNPLHHGHEALVAAAADFLKLAPLFELPVTNADKGTLDATEVQRRAAHFAGKHTLILSRVPLFSDKAALYCGSVFVVGYDTAERLIEPRYYGGNADMQQAMDAVRAAGCRFVVAGRLANDRFHTLADLDLSSALADLFSELPETVFRADVSSTALREHDEHSS